MTTASSIINDGLQAIGNISPGETVKAEDANSAFLSLNRMLDSWSTDKLFVFQMFQESFPLTANIANYSIGPGGDFNTIRPTQITKAFLRVSDLDYDIQIINDSGYANIGQKSTYAGYPQYLNYNPTLVLGTINIWPFPQSNMRLFIQSPKQLSKFVSLSDDVILAPGYEEAILYALITRLSSLGLGRASADQISLSESSIARIKILNSKVPVLRSEFVSNMNGDGNIFDGFF